MNSIRNEFTDRKDEITNYLVFVSKMEMEEVNIYNGPKSLTPILKS